MARAKRLLGLDIGTAAVKAVELSREGEALKVTGVSMAPLANPAETASVVKEVIRQGSFHTKLAASNVSGRLVSIKYITLPAMTDEEMKKALPFEADKHIPFDVKDTLLDGQRIGQAAAEAKEMTAVLVAAKRNLVLERADLLNAVGLCPQIVDADVFALGNAYELSLQAGAERKGSVAIVDIGASKTSVNILRNGATCFTREIYIAGNDLRDAIAKRLSLSPEEAEKIKCSPGSQEDACKEAASMPLEDLTNELRMSLEFYENQFESSVDEVCLAGGGSRLPWLPETLGTAFGKPARPWNPFEKLVGEGQGLDASSLAARGGTFAVALGLAARLGTL